MATAVDEIEESAWVPTSKQVEFLAAPEREVLYGGAAGGGKTDALIMDAPGLNMQNGPRWQYDAAFQNPLYRALLIRPSRTELLEVIDRCKRWYPKIDPGVRWLDSKGFFEFSSGARVELAYLKEEADKFRYNSREFQYIGWEELTTHPTSSGYEYLKSRLRAPKSANLKCYIRATTNPVGPGFEWVKEYWRIQDDGGPTCFEHTQTLPDGRKLTVQRRFIPAKVEDNPHIDDSYVFTLSDMASEEDVRALRDGRWDAVEVPGIIYKKSLDLIIKEGRRCDLPYIPGHPVNLFWDIGRADSCAIWFHQYVDNRHRFINYYESSQEGLDHYINVIQRQGYVLGTFYLPHDATQKTMAAPDSIEDLIRNFNYDVIVVPKVSNISHGIELTRRVLASSWFDTTKTQDGFKALRNYKYEQREDGSFSSQPKHDKWSHAADAIRQCGQGFRATSSPWAALREPASSNGVPRRKRAQLARSRVFNPDTKWVV